MSDYGPLDTKMKYISDVMRKDGFNPVAKGDLPDVYLSKFYDYIMWLRDQAHIDLPDGMMRGSLPESSEEKTYT